MKGVQTKISLPEQLPFFSLHHSWTCTTSQLLKLSQYFFMEFRGF